MSSEETSSYPAALAVDGNGATRWSSAFADPGWIAVDLGTSVPLDRVRIDWEAAYATAYTVETSDDGVTWTVRRSVTAGDGGTDEHTGLGVTARYLRVHGTTRATAYGYSIWELEVYGPTT